MAAHQEYRKTFNPSESGPPPAQTNIKLAKLPLDLGYEVGAIVFAVGLALVAAAYFWTKVSHAILFWAAFILTRPLGATVGDLLDKPVASGGLALSRYTASAVLAVFIIACIVFSPQRAEKIKVDPSPQPRA